MTKHDPNHFAKFWSHDIPNTLNELIATQYKYTEPQLDAARAKLRHSGQPSVDRFLELQEPNTHEFDICKIAMCYWLLATEQWAIQKNFDPPGGWYSHFYQHLATTLHSGSINDLAVITFNYDRSMELWLATYMRTLPEFQSCDTFKLVNDRIKFIHVYGSLSSDVQWDPIDQRYNTDRITFETCTNSSDSIRIISEQRNNLDDPTLDEAKSVIQGAHRILFLGFGFDPENMERIGAINLADKEVHGTAFSLHRAERTRALNLIAFGKRRPYIWSTNQHQREHYLTGTGVDCLTLLRERISW